MKHILINIILLLYAFSNIPVEITDIFLAYLIPFCLSATGLLICIRMHREISKLTQSKLKKIRLIFNWVTLTVFGSMTLWNTPVPESRGYRNKNWTDMDMIIDPQNPEYQFVGQHIEYGGSDMPSRRRKVKKINWWLRWSEGVEENHPKDGKWLYVSNLSQENSVPIGLNETKIDYETEKHRAKMVLFKNKKIITPTNTQ